MNPSTTSCCYSGAGIPFNNMLFCPIKLNLEHSSTRIHSTCLFWNMHSNSGCFSSMCKSAACCSGLLSKMPCALTMPQQTSVVESVAMNKSPPMPHPHGAAKFTKTLLMPHLLGHDFVSNPLLFPSNPHFVPGWGVGESGFSLTNA